MSWFKKIFPSKVEADLSQKKGVPEGIWTKCPSCASVLYAAELERNLSVCPKCNHHLRLSGRERIASFLDENGQEELAKDVEAVDPLKFRDTKKYKDRISAAKKKTQETEALIVMRGTVYGLPVVVTSFNFAFIGGSMGSAVGERFVRAVNACIENSCPLICFSTSGGARMQEGLISLMQMAKTSAALGVLSEHRLPYISVLVDPTMGGVSASLAMLGDIIIAEPHALIGFAGPRVIEQTVRETLPEGFQRSEFLLEHGAIDMIVNRHELRHKIANMLGMLTHKSIAITDEDSDAA